MSKHAVKYQVVIVQYGKISNQPFLLQIYLLVTAGKAQV